MNRSSRSGVRNYFNPVTQAISEGRGEDAAAILTKALVEADGSQTKAATAFGVSDRTVRNWIVTVLELTQIDVRVNASAELDRDAKAKTPARSA